MFDNHFYIANSRLKLEQYIWNLALKFKYYIVAIFLTIVSTTLFKIEVDYKVKEIIDSIADNQSADLAYLLFLFVFYKLLYHGILFINKLVEIRYKPLIIEQSLLFIFGSTLKHSLSWFDSHLSGEIQNKISDFNNTILLLITYLSQILIMTFGIAVILYYLSTIHYLSATILLVFIIFYFPIIYILLKKQFVLQGSKVTARQEAMGVVNDSITNVYSIKIIGNVLNEINLKLLPAIAKWKKLERKTRIFDAYYVELIDNLMVVSMSGIQIYTLAYLYKNGDISAGSFAFIAMMTLKIHSKLETLLMVLMFNFNPSLAQLKSSYSFINDNIDTLNRDNAGKLIHSRGEIRFEKVSVGYARSQKKALSNLSLSIKPGERVGIVGPSGAGKTTLVKSLIRYFDVNSGSIKIDGKDIRDYTLESLRENMAIIPQDITLLHRSVRENLLLAKYDATEAELIDICKKANIHDVIMSFPNKYDTIVGERGVKLSGGQRQRIAIARAMLKKAPILILDEATSSLDTLSEEEIKTSMNNLFEQRQTTIIAIAHRLSTLGNMDRIIVLDKGSVVQEGVHKDLIKDKNGYYYKLWNMQKL